MSDIIPQNEEKKSNITSEKVTKQNIKESINLMLDSIDKLPLHAKMHPLNQYDLSSLLFVLLAILEAD